MGKFTVTHTIDCDVDTFWKTLFDKELTTNSTWERCVSRILES